MSVTALGGLQTGVDPLLNLSNGATRLSSAAKEFESVLLGQWLKNAESTFGSVPGEEADDAEGEQMKEFARQQVAAEITNHGGIGIAPMVERGLAKQAKQDGQGR